MPVAYDTTFHVRWGDVDSNGHMRNTAYLDQAAEVRMTYFKSKGFLFADFEKRRLGPVIQRDKCEYFRELRMQDIVLTTLRLTGLAPDNSRFEMTNEFFRPDGKLAARITSLGGWFDQKTRRWTTPPMELATIVADLERTANFAALESIVKKEAAAKPAAKK